MFIYVFSVLLQFLLLLQTHGQHDTKEHKPECVCFPNLKSLTLTFPRLCLGLPYPICCQLEVKAQAGGRPCNVKPLPHGQLMQMCLMSGTFTILQHTKLRFNVYLFLLKDDRQ